MKTISRMVRRYVIAAFVIVLGVLLLNIAFFSAEVLTQKDRYTGFEVRKLANSFVQTDTGHYQPTWKEWDNRCAWAMLLGDNGEILWSEHLPEKLNHPYTVPETAAFSRWYLDDYPLMVYRNDFGLVVAGLPRGSMTRFNFYMDTQLLNALLDGTAPLLLMDCGLLLAICLLLGWRGARPLWEIGKGIDSLAEGQAVTLQEKGFSAELAEKLNRTSRHLQQQAALIQRRDNARTNWIAGVSHDIRTPLALILGYAEQLERDADSAEIQQKATLISEQSRKIRSLIEDLNLTSKLQYNAQPLRIEQVCVGPLVRKCVADFCNSGFSQQCEVEVALSDAVNQIQINLDPGLFARMLENLLNNSARHNSDGCTISVDGQVVGDALSLTAYDNGMGYPEAILDILQHPERQEDENSPHVLGLHLVRQIAEAHGGRVRFWNDNGANAEVIVPLSPERAG